MMNHFQKESGKYLNTGCTHSAAIAGSESIIVFREDIGRHNAVDKVIGDRLINHDSLEGAILLSSGRISSEIVLKVQRGRIPVIISISAPTDRAIIKCREANITLVGFARGRRMNVYSGERRII